MLAIEGFGTLRDQSLGSAASGSPERAVLFYATAYPESGKAVARLISASGFAPILIGGADQLIRTKVGGDLHEFCKLGSLVTTNEAEDLI